MTGLYLNDGAFKGAYSRGISDMSVKRDVLADIFHVNEEEVKCEKCSACDEEKLFTWCSFWKTTTKNSAFCSLWLPKGVD